MDLKRDDHVKLAEKLKQIQQDVEAINRVMQATYRKEFARAAHQIAHDLMSLRLSLAHKLDEELPDADGYQIYFGDDTKGAEREIDTNPIAREQHSQAQVSSSLANIDKKS